MNWKELLVDPFKEMLTRFLGFLPTLLRVLIVLIVGWLIAKLIQKLITRGLKLLRLDVLAERSGVHRFFSKGEIKYTLSELLGVLVYWFMLIAVGITAINALGLTVAGDLFSKVVLYIPKVIVSIFILVLGMFFATFMNTTVRTASTNAGISQARLLGQLTQIAIIIFAIAVAAEQLNIGTRIITSLVTILLGSFGLAVGLAFGLGCKDMAAKFLQDWLEKTKSKVW
ncbi:MAG: hypothetical protein NC898_03340 [Candidatus Omnitrophica bacterium]|nr:hypothetical protein [Candidatus Omnitrophota bacterium]MCM8793485.1 hypothetical protein [Candidatus Omnitrophota bacterium]